MCIEKDDDSLKGAAPGLGVMCTGLLLHEDSKMGTDQELMPW